jgi:hypothetical protein
MVENRKYMIKYRDRLERVLRKNEREAGITIDE